MREREGREGGRKGGRGREREGERKREREEGGIGRERGTEGERGGRGRERERDAHSMLAVTPIAHSTAHSKHSPRHPNCTKYIDHHYNTIIMIV